MLIVTEKTNRLHVIQSPVVDEEIRCLCGSKVDYGVFLYTLMDYHSTFMELPVYDYMCALCLTKIGCAGEA